MVKDFADSAGLFKATRSRQIRGSIVVRISTCHAEDPGSIPGRGVVPCYAQLHTADDALMLLLLISTKCATARLAQAVERKALNLVVVGSSPTVGVCSINLHLRVLG